MGRRAGTWGGANGGSGAGTWGGGLTRGAENTEAQELVRGAGRAGRGACAGGLVCPQSSSACCHWRKLAAPAPTLSALIRSIGLIASPSGESVVS